MAIEWTHTTAADGTFSTTGATEWNRSHSLSGMTAGQILYPSDATTLTSSANFLWSADITAGKGLTLAAGTAASAVNAFALSQTWNYNTAQIVGVDWQFTDTSSHSTTLAFRIRGGAAGTTNLLSLDKAGICTTGGFVPNTAQAVTNGMTLVAANQPAWYANSTFVYRITSAGLQLQDLPIVFGGAANASIVQNLNNGLSFGEGSGNTINGGGAKTRVEYQKLVTSIADNTATTVFTVTVPNAAHSASIRVRLTGSMGAGGAVGANESTQDAEYQISIARTAGVNAVATIGPTYGQAAAASVAGAGTIAVSATLGAVSGAVGASNTFTIDVTIARSGGSSTNHTCLAFAELLNANATGVTIA